VRVSKRSTRADWHEAPIATRARRLMWSTAWRCRWHALTHGTPASTALGTSINGVSYGSISARILQLGPRAEVAAVEARGVAQRLVGRTEGDGLRGAPGGRGGLRQCWVSLVLKEGKNRGELSPLSPRGCLLHHHVAVSFITSMLSPLSPLYRASDRLIEPANS
jgi:hypothetical protein